MKNKSYLIIFASNLSSTLRAESSSIFLDKSGRSKETLLAEYLPRDNTKRKNVKITIKYNVFRDRAVAKIMDKSRNKSYKYFSM